jgi:hypothetical protein
MASLTIPAAGPPLGMLSYALQLLAVLDLSHSWESAHQQQRLPRSSFESVLLLAWDLVVESKSARITP